MTKITLADVINLQNENTAVSVINTNSATIETAFDNTLSRDGTTPNTMLSDFDMNSHRILNLPAPLSSNEPARLQDIGNVNQAAAAAAAAAVTATAQAVIATNAAATASAVSGAYNGTSTSSVAIGTGAKTFATQTGKLWTVGDMLLISSAANPTHAMHGTVTTYGTGSLVMNVLDVLNSGTHADWNITISGTQGTPGTTPWAVPAAWVTSTAYVAFSVGVPASVVTNSGSSYVCLVSHTSGTFATDLGAGKWLLIAQKGSDGAGTGDFSTNTSSSVDSEVVLFSSTTGKLAKRATTTGIAKLTSGVLSAATAGTDYYNPGGTDVAVLDGGTGSSTASGARTNLGLVIGSNVQAFDPNYNTIPQNPQASNYTTVLSDQGGHILHATSSGSATYTIPTHASVAYPVGATLVFVNQHGAGACSIACNGTMYWAGSGTSNTTTPRTLATNGIATAIQLANDEWLISGTGLT